jgi:SpoVK/Ycf46/Vps4 family AAA+-type ATPase
LELLLPTIYIFDSKYHELATDTFSGGYSGAEIIAICRDAAMLALEEYDECDDNQDDNDNVHDVILKDTKTDVSENPTTHSDHTTQSKVTIQMRHLLQAIQSTTRQITPSMLEFYANYTNSISIS